MSIFWHAGMRRMKGQNCERTGSTMVEFALTLPLLALLLFGIIQYGFIFAAYMTLRNASAVGARYAILTAPAPTVSQIQSVAQGAVGPMLKTSIAVATVQQNVTVGGVGGATSVTVQYNLPLI